MAKIKQHIINNKTHYCCGLKINKHKPTAFYDNNVLYNFDGEQVTFNNMNEICINCLKLSNDVYYNKLLNEKRSFEYKNSIPKQSIFKKRWNVNKRKSIIKHSLKPKINKDNIIYLPWNPVVIKDTHRLIEYKPIIESDNIDNNIKPESIVSVTPTNDTEIIYEDTFIQFNNGLAMIKGFNNDWMIVLQSNGKTEPLTEFMEYNKALAEIKSLAA